MPSVWYSCSQYRALASRKLRTSRRPKLKISVPQSGCEPRRGSACSKRALPSKRASAHSSRGKCAGTQSRITPTPAWCRRSTKARNWSGVPKRGVGAKYELVARALGDAGAEERPDARRAQRAHRVQAPVPRVGVTHHRDRARRRRPHGEGHPRGAVDLRAVRADLLVELLVAPLAG